MTERGSLGDDDDVLTPEEEEIRRLWDLLQAATARASDAEVEVVKLNLACEEVSAKLRQVENAFELLKDERDYWQRLANERSGEIVRLSQRVTQLEAQVL